MKKTLLLLASAAMLLVGCAKEKFSPEAGDAEMVNVTISALVQGEELTKAAIDEDGKGVNANRCIMVLYYGDQVYGRYTAAVSNYKATFDVKVPAKRTYNAVFWADYATADGEGGFTDVYYSTADLTNITLKSDYVGNDDKRDAFFKCKEYTVENKSQSFTAELTRPFAQINVISKDIKDLHLAALYPQKVNLSFAAATSFNAMSGKCGAAEPIRYEANVYKAYDATKEQLTLSMDYLFAGDRSTVDIDFKAPTEGTLKVEHNFSNIPYQRNYRTNIIGNLLTADAHWDVTINPKWNEPDEEVKFVEAGSVAAANEAFANGATSVKITSVGEETTLYLPVLTDEVTIDFANPSKVITVKYGPAPTKAAGEKPAVVNIATNDVTKFVVSGISNVVWLAGNQAALANALNNAVAGQTVALVNDITMTGEWTPVTSYSGTFDGKNHIINNLKVSDYSGDYIGFFSAVSGATIKNVTFKGAVLTNTPDPDEGNRRGAVIVGWSYACKIDNCHVINASVSGCQKVAGILGAMSVEGSAGQNSVTNCSVDNLTLSSCNTEDVIFQSGALIGYIQLINANPDGILIENNSVKDITINDDCGDRNNVGYYNGTFIGTISRKQKVDGQKIVLNNNTIAGTNTEVFKTIYSSPYFGWATNAENYSTGALAPILIDGVEWTPNYPIKNVTKGTGYPTLAAAVSAASEGDEITLENGEYTLPSLSNITLTGLGNNVVVNHASGQICATNNVTIKNFVFNLGQGGYHGFQHASNLVLDGCTFNGFQTTYGSTTYKNCTFNQDTYAYNMNAYGAEIVCDNCVFNGKGKAVYVYNEGNGGMYHISFNNCVFNEEVGAGTTCKAAILVKENVDNQKYIVNINNCIANFDKYVPDDPDLTGSSLWNMELKDGVTGTDVTVNLNNEKVYPFTKFSVSDAAGLRNAIKMFNKGKEQVEYSIELADGTYEVSDMVIAQNVSGKSLTIKAATAKGVTLKIPATHTFPYIFMVNGCSSYDETRAITFNGFKFDVSAITSVDVAPVMNMSSKEDYSEIGYPKATQGHANDYGGYITIDNCELIGGNGSRNDKAVMYLANSGSGSKNITVKNSTLTYAGYLLATYVDGFTAENVITATPVRHFINNQTSGITVKNCVVDCDTDYAIRANAGPVSITGSKFVMTYNGSDKGGIYVDRGNNTQLTMTGNTYPATYAGANMHDVYNEKGGPCIISNGSQEVKTLENGETYDFPRN